MHQILFHLPFGIPVYGFGMMLFLAFVVVTTWAGWRVAKVGLPKEKVQDLAIALFVSGLLGARVLYMWQYYDEFPDKSPVGLAKSFFSIWEGGIVFYGSIFGGIVGYMLFRHYVLKRLGVNGWQLADAVAPLMAIGLAVGRIGCFLNGCCWGQVACEECQPVPLSAELGKFPLLPAHARKQLIYPPGKEARLPQGHGLQTTTGYSVNPEPGADPRVILRVEPGSDAAAAGLKTGDVVVEADGSPNYVVLALYGPDGAVAGAASALKASGGVVLSDADRGEGVRTAEVGFESWPAAASAQAKLLGARATGVEVAVRDVLGDRVREGQWPRGKNGLSLAVERDGQRLPITYTPRTVGFYPTQVYETLSMVLLTLLLLAFQPIRRHDGQVMVVCMLGYALHRFLNEAIRIEPTYAFGLTLSQWISVGIFAAGLLLELYLRWSQPKLPPGPQPLGVKAAA